MAEFTFVAKIEALIGVSISLVLLWAFYNNMMLDTTVSSGVNYYNTFGIPIGFILILFIPIILYVIWKERTDKGF
jgi:uncharacterized membrane protein (DUF485 family)